nr:MAG: nonstructural protein [Feral pigeon parvovirus A]
MACPTKGGYSAIFMLPETIVVKHTSDGNAPEEIDIRSAVNCGWAKDAQAVVGNAYNNEESNYRAELLAFHNASDHLLDNDKWYQLHWDAAMYALGREAALHPGLKLFAQLEEDPGTGRCHVHIMLIQGLTSRGMSWMMKRLRTDITKYITEALTGILGPYIAQGQIWSSISNASHAWLSLKRCYNPKFGKSIPMQCNPHSFLKYYFYQKTAPELVLRWASTKAIEMGLEIKNVLDVYNLEGQDDDPESPVAEMRPGDLLPITYVSTDTHFDATRAVSTLKPGLMDVLLMEALRLCKENFIFTKEDFMNKFPEKYLQFASRTGGVNKLVDTINLYTQNIVTEHNAWELCKAMYGSRENLDMSQNLVYKLFVYQTYDPAYAAHTICCWLSGQLGKKNCLYLYGPANTGKTMIAEAICKMVKVYGNVNHNNGNFPFNDCHGKAVLWWEECIMVDTYVEPAKCILGGSAVRVDKKGEDSVLIKKTPIVITSNNDITSCTSRNIVMTTHAAPIRARSLKFTFNTWLTSNWGLITPEMMYEFLIWGEGQAPISLEGWIRLNPKFGGVIPYNQPHAQLCDGCLTQVTGEHTVELCDHCGCWKPSERAEEVLYNGSSEKDLYENLGEGRNRCKSRRGVR